MWLDKYAGGLVRITGELKHFRIIFCNQEKTGKKGNRKLHLSSNPKARISHAATSETEMNRNDLRSPPVVCEATVYCNSQVKKGCS